MGRRRRRTAFVLALALAGTSLLPTAARASAPGGSAEAGSSDWRQVSVGALHTCGIRTSGRLYCWGRDTYGQLGDDVTVAEKSRPVEVAGGATNWVAVSAGAEHTCGLRRTGRLYCWGADGGGQLGNGLPNADQHTPVLTLGSGWTSVAAGGSHTCGRRSSGRLFCWGYDGAGQLGDGGGGTIRSAPREVAGGATTWSNAISAGTEDTCALRTTGRLFCWGSDLRGQLGNGGTNTNSFGPTQVAGGITTWVSVAVGYEHACALRASGRLFCWGGDDSGELGNGGASTERDVPTLVAGGGRWTRVATGNSHTCARRPSGRLSCWGWDIGGGLGDGGTNTDKGVPTAIVGGATDWTLVDGGDYHTCSRITSGRLYCWGSDLQGQLGNGPPNADHGEPVEVAA